jgi:hypothetical protein
VRTILIALLFFAAHLAVAQTGVIRGKVFNKISNEAVPFANIAIQSTTMGAVADENGNYVISNLSPGLYNLEASFVGFKKLIIYEVQVTNARPAMVDFELEEEARNLEEVVIMACQYLCKIRRVSAFPAHNRYN